MKKLIPILLMSLFIMAGCEKEQDPGNLKIAVSYYYNQYIGYRPDVGATAFLWEDENLRCSNWVYAKLGIVVNGEVNISHDYMGEADLTGTINIVSIPPGAYYLVVASSGRYTYSEKVITIPSGGTLELVKNFYYLNEFEKEPW